MSKQAAKLIEIAFALKEKHPTNKKFHLTGIFNKNKLLSIGVNNTAKTHPQILNYNYHNNAKLHSEMSACLKLGMTDCSGLILVNIRIDNNNQLSMAAPCLGCRDLIQALNFKAVFYTDEKGNIQKLT